MDDNGDEEYASQVVDAYLAEVNVLDSKFPQKFGTWTLGLQIMLQGTLQYFLPYHLAQA